MYLFRHLLGPALVTTSLWAFSQDTPAPAPISQPAAEYLNSLLDLMPGKMSLHRTEIDWTAVRAGALLHVQGAQTRVDTYPGIYFALIQLPSPIIFPHPADTLSNYDKAHREPHSAAFFCPRSRGSSIHRRRHSQLAARRMAI